MPQRAAMSCPTEWDAPASAETDAENEQAGGHHPASTETITE